MLFSMSLQNEIGKKGEAIARTYLINKGYEIIESNWRFSHCELDIIAKNHSLLVFIEVKTRSYTYYGQPEDSIDARKEILLSEAAAAYMRSIKYGWEFRFDFVSIVLSSDGRHKIKHYEDAFFPGLS